MIRYRRWKNIVHATQACLILSATLRKHLYAGRPNHMEDHHLSATRLAILLLASAWSTTTGGIMPWTVRRLAECLQLSTKTVQRNLDAMATAGLLTIREGHCTDDALTLKRGSNMRVVSLVPDARRRVFIRPSGARSPKNGHIELYPGLAGAVAGGLLTRDELIAYVALAFFADAWWGTAFPSIDTLADALHASKANVREWIEGLIRKGWILRVYGQRHLRHAGSGELYVLAPYPRRDCPAPVGPTARERRLQAFLVVPANQKQVANYPAIQFGV